MPQSIIFDKYGAAAQRKTGPSTGLGLPFCKKVIEAHCGEIGVVSEPNQGAIFYATISTRLDRLVCKILAA